MSVSTTSWFTRRTLPRVPAQNSFHHFFFGGSAGFCPVSGLPAGDAGGPASRVRRHIVSAHYAQVIEHLFERAGAGD
ncbi:MAG TPA: hypothetical protein VEZ71_15970 [Archangium sp.]|nr:hypothetical protein [Archangium sp.]